MKRYVQVGCGNRGIFSYALPMVRDYADCAELCGVYDINHKRAALVSELVGKKIPVFEDFDEMLRVVKPDTVIITPKDCAHDEYAIRAMRAGCDVIVEKPLTTTFEKALEIERVQKETGKEVVVTFNLRFHPLFKRIKELIASGIIGKILSVHYEWMLDRSHGADYFRRWHRERQNSGSLMVHKSTHHFDLINWYLEEDPIEVNAFGTRRFYGSTRENHGERCSTCPYAGCCEFFKDYIHDPDMSRLYFSCEDVDGYYRDKCVFSEEIDIEDSVSVNVRYSGGAVMSYSLTAHSPYEGVNMVLNGTDGRLEICVHNNTVKLFNQQGMTEIAMPKTGDEDHGGADVELRDRLFREKDRPDPLTQMVDLRAGMMSIGIGMAANLSMKEGRRVALGEFYRQLNKEEQ